MADEQLAAFLFSALIASASLLASSFGNLYAVYARSVSEMPPPPISITIRRICYALAVTVLVITGTCAYIFLTSLAPRIDRISWVIKYPVYLILLLINLAPTMIAGKIFQDGRSN